MLAKGARLQGIPGMQEPIKLWRMDGMVTKVDGATIYLINASGGRPDEPSPDSGEVIQLPVAQTRRGPGRGEERQGGRSGRSPCGASRRPSRPLSSAKAASSENRRRPGISRSRGVAFFVQL